MESYNSQHCETFGHDWVMVLGRLPHYCMNCGVAKEVNISILQACMLGFNRLEDGCLHADWTRFVHYLGPEKGMGT